METGGRLHRFNPDHHAKLDDPERLKWQNPKDLMEFIEPEIGDTIVDIGSGTGFFALTMAEVWPAAKLVAADISPEMTKLLTGRAEERGLKNIETVTIDGKNLPFGDYSADMVLLINVLHEFDNPQQVLADIRRILKPGGRLVIVDWKKDLTPVGPPLEDRIGEGEAYSMVAELDFEPLARPEIYPHHYALVFV